MHVDGESRLVTANTSLTFSPRQLVPPRGPTWGPVLRPVPPGRLLRPSAEDANHTPPKGRIELVHCPPGPLPPLPVQLTP